MAQLIDMKILIIFIKQILRWRRCQGEDSKLRQRKKIPTFLNASSKQFKFVEGKFSI